MRYYWLTIGILGAWQITQLLHAADGPWGGLRRLRALLVRSGAGNAVACFYCLATWVALPVAMLVGETWAERSLLWFALAGAVSLLQRTQEGAAPPPVDYREDPPARAQTQTQHPLNEGNDDVQLWQQKAAVGSVRQRPSDGAGRER
jgi:hypothetical protein